MRNLSLALGFLILIIGCAWESQRIFQEVRRKHHPAVIPAPILFEEVKPCGMG